MSVKRNILGTKDVGDHPIHLAYYGAASPHGLALMRNDRVSYYYRETYSDGSVQQVKGVRECRSSCMEGYDEYFCAPGGRDASGHAIDLSSDDKLIALASNEAVSIRTIGKNGRPEFYFDMHVKEIKFSPDSTKLAMHTGLAVFVVDLETGAVTMMADSRDEKDRSLYGSEESCWQAVTLSWSADSKLLCSTLTRSSGSWPSVQPRLTAHDVETGKIVHTRRVGKYTACSMIPGTNDMFLFAYPRSLEICKLTEDAKMETVRKSETMPWTTPIRSVAISSDGRLASVVPIDARTCLCDLSPDAGLEAYQTGIYQSRDNVIFHPVVPDKMGRRRYFFTLVNCGTGHQCAIEVLLAPSETQASV